MKNLFFITPITAIILSSSISNAQTLNQTTHAPAVGDNYSFQYADPSSLPANLGNPGTGNTFNFSGLSVYPGSNTSQGITPASTGSTSAYPSANVAVQTGTDNTFYNSQSNKLDFYGGNLTLGGYPITLTYTTPAVLGTYPMNLNTTNTGTIAGTINALGNSGSFTGVNSFTANATGTLIVPGGAAYNNVIRVQTQQNMTFTISFIQGTLNINQYDYYAPSYSNFPNANNNWPVITVQQSTLSSTAFGSSIQTSVTINSNYQTLNVNTNNTPIYQNITISPNPAKDWIKIQTPKNTDIKNIQIKDITGKVVRQTEKTKIECSEFQNGIYFIRIEDSNGKITTEKILIQH